MNLLKFLFTLTISLLLPAFCLATNNNSINTYHFNSTNPKLDVLSIVGMDNIREMFSAGKYAWASDNAVITFYDGKVWSAPQTIPGMSLIIFVKPAYPIHGEQAFAWAEGFENSQIVISYFNGTSWSTALPITEQSNKFRFLTAEGKLWIIYQDDTGIHIQHSDTTNPLSFISLPTFGNDAFLHATLNYDDADLYFTSRSESQAFTVKRVKLDNSVTVLYQDDETFEGQVRIKNNRILLTRYESSISYYSLDKGLTWKPIQNTAPALLFGFAKGGVTCGLALSANSSDRINYCVNLSDATPMWNLTSNSSYYFADGFTDNNGMWLVTPETNQVTYWNSHTNKTNDTHIDMIAKRIFHSDYSNSSKSVGNNQLITFGTNKNNEPSVLYFDNAVWSVYPFVGKLEKEICQAYDLSEQNIWIFSHARCNPDSDNDYQMYIDDWY